MALTLSQLWTQPTLAAIKQKVIDTAALVGLPVDTWVFGDPSERWTEIISRVIHEFGSSIIVSTAKWFFLDSATDPGDDGHPNTTPGEGALSGLGQGRFGTTRGGQTFGTTTLEVTNDNLATIYLRSDLVVERDHPEDDGGTPTYTATEDDTVYVNLDGTLTVAPGATVEIPIRADIIGTYSNAGSNEITVLQTGTYGSLSVTNPNPILASEREDADEYRTRCRRATSRVATGAPTELYKYAANTDLNGDPLQRHDGSGQVGTTRIFVDDFTDSGEVVVLLADEDGPADTVDVESADANITGIPLGEIVDPIGVVPGSITYSTDAATPQAVTINGTAKLKYPSGVTEDDVKDAIKAALAAYLSTIPIGGLDQIAGTGYIYRNDLEAIVKGSYPGLYAVDISLPATSTTVVAYGAVCTLTFGTWTIANGSGP